MNTQELAYYLLKYKNNKVLNGVFASDKLPSNIKLPFGCIVNLAESNLPGSHWCSIFIDEFGTLEWMDSYGFKPNSHRILHFIKMHSKNVIYNKVQLQHISSNTCGKYALVFLIHKLNGGTLSGFTKLFSKNTYINDILINNYFKYISFQ